LGDGAIATAGLTEGMATERGYDVVAVTIEGPNRHPGIMPGAANTKDKLVMVNAAEMAVSEMRRPYTDGG
jgi:NADH oxidase (H2O2-forming)